MNIDEKSPRGAWAEHMAWQQAVEQAEKAVKSADFHAEVKSLEVALDRAFTRIDELKFVLQEVRDYLLDATDCDWDSERGFIPNEENRLLHAVETVLRERV